jgi:hypothetical protein
MVARKVVTMAAPWAVEMAERMVEQTVEWTAVTLGHYLVES